MVSARPSLDSPGVSLGDRAFLSLNQRLEPEQLGPGQVSVSLNGRMDRGSWQPRKAIENVSGALQSDDAPLRLPFFLVDTSGGDSISAASRVDDLVTVTTTAAHGFTLAATGYLGIEDLTGTVDPNGVRFITVTNTDEFTFEIPGATGNETYGGTGVYRSVLDDTAAAEILGSCLYSDPSSESAEFVVIAANGEAYKVELADGTVTAIAYPTGGSLTGPVDLVQAFDRVYLFRDGLQTWEWRTPLGRPVTAAALASNVVTVTVANHGLTVGDTVTLSDIGFTTTDPNGSRTVASIPTADTFTFALTGADETYTTDADSLAVSAFTKVRAGAFTQPQVFEATGGDVDVVSGLCTVTITGNTTIKDGDTITIFGSDEPRFADFLGREFLVTSASSTAVSFYIPVEDLSTIDTAFLSIGKAVSIGAGFQHMPAPPWGVYHQRRLIVPYRYSQTGTTASPTFTDRDVRDELVISDILDPDTYDVIANQYRITAGIADFIVGVHPFYEDTALVFMRNSIHGIFGLAGSLADTVTRELTREIGCLARKSIVQHGAEILFLADNGVYAIGFIDQYNLRGADTPLSEAIQPVIDRINADLAGDAVGTYFANRYYLAVPLDSTAGAGDATGNNAILVYNFLNKGWESVDSVGDSRWDVLNFHIGRSGARNDLYAVNSLGGVHLLDAADDDNDEVAISPGEAVSSVSVASSLSTRQYDGQTLDRKRFTEIQVQLESAGQNSDAEFSMTTEDPDDSADLGTISDMLSGTLPANGGASLRRRTGGQRGHGAILSITPTAGRPKVKSVKILATVTNRSTTTQE